MDIKDIKLTTPQDGYKLSSMEKPLDFLFQKMGTNEYAFLHLTDNSTGSFVIEYKISESGLYMPNPLLDTPQDHSIRGLLFELLCDFEICPKFKDEAKWHPLPTIPAFLENRLIQTINDNKLL